MKPVRWHRLPVCKVLLNKGDFPFHFPGFYYLHTSNILIISMFISTKWQTHFLRDIRKFRNSYLMLVRRENFWCYTFWMYWKRKREFHILYLNLIGIVNLSDIEPSDAVVFCRRNECHNWYFQRISQFRRRLSSKHHCKNYIDTLILLAQNIFWSYAYWIGECQAKKQPLSIAHFALKFEEIKEIVTTINIDISRCGLTTAV